MMQASEHAEKLQSDPHYAGLIRAAEMALQAFHRAMKELEDQYPVDNGAHIGWLDGSVRPMTTGME
jgi:prepilin-type processing-associated H-X9-DG protein